jgi:hypothetical protein
MVQYQSNNKGGYFLCFARQHRENCSRRRGGDSAWLVGVHGVYIYCMYKYTFYSVPVQYSIGTVLFV